MVRRPLILRQSGMLIANAPQLGLRSSPGRWMVHSSPVSAAMMVMSRGDSPRSYAMSALGPRCGLVTSGAPTRVTRRPSHAGVVNDAGVRKTLAPRSGIFRVGDDAGVHVAAELDQLFQPLEARVHVSREALLEQIEEQATDDRRQLPLVAPGDLGDAGPCDVRQLRARGSPPLVRFSNQTPAPGHSRGCAPRRRWGFPAAPVPRELRAGARARSAQLILRSEIGLVPLRPLGQWRRSLTTAWMAAGGR